MHMRSSKRYQTSGLWLSALGAVVLAAGCNSGQGSTPSLDVQTSYDNLTTDLSICAKSTQTCLEAADGDRPKIQTCEDERMSCETAVNAARKEVHDGIRACVDTARTCAHNIGDGGVAALRACGQAFHSCVQDALPPPPPVPPCVEALRECLSHSEDGGRAARDACGKQFRMCAEAELPPCAHGLATCIDKGGSFWACERAAAKCRDFRLSHDGGVPPNP
jgi:hypothetical protein